MNDKKNIDRLFQEKFKDFEMAPNDKVWENIEAQLGHKKKKRRVIPIWWQLGGVAATLLLLFTVGNAVFNNDSDLPVVVETEVKTNSEIIEKDKKFTPPNNNENTTVVSNSSQSNTNSNVQDIEDKNLKTSKNSVANSKNNPVLPDENETEVLARNESFNSGSDSNSNLNLNKNSSTSKTNNNPKTSEKNTVASNSIENTKNLKSNTTELKPKNKINEILKANTTNSNNAVVELNGLNKENLDDKTDTIIEEKEKGQAIEEAIAEVNKINEKEEEKETRRWSIAPNVAPVFFNSLGEGSSIDSQFNNNTTSSDISVSYGLKGSYAVNSRLRITAGVNRVNFNNTTNNVIALSNNDFSSGSVATGRFQNIDLKSGLDHSSLTLISRPNIDANSIPESIKAIETGDLEQRFGFIEIPLEIEYRLIDKKVGLNISSGFSTLLLNENEIFADINGENALLGQANNINNTSFSANFGIGLDYSLSKQLNINLEPKFKYQLNTFNNTSGDFRPFFIGVYTGLNFRF